jgi:hypothetical protein
MHDCFRQVLNRLRLWVAKPALNRPLYRSGAGQLLLYLQRGPESLLSSLHLRRDLFALVPTGRGLRQLACGFQILVIWLSLPGT